LPCQLAWPPCRSATTRRGEQPISSSAPRGRSISDCPGLVNQSRPSASPFSGRGHSCAIRPWSAESPCPAVRYPHLPMNATAQADAALPSGTVTFLFTDIEGSTTLWEQYPEGMRVALARQDALLRQAIESSDGRIVKTTGDGVFAVFAAAPDAL